MAETAVTVTGLKEVRKMLGDVSGEVARKGFTNGLAAAINVIAAELRRKTPVKTGKLAKAIIATVQANESGGIAKVGFGREGHVANFLEYGHRITGHRPARKRHGEVRANPFIRGAFDASADNAVRAFEDSITETLKNA